MKILLCAGDRTEKVVKYLVENRKSSIDIDMQPSILEGINAINERGMIYDKLVIFGYTFDKYTEDQLNKIFINLSTLAKDLSSTQEIVIFAARGNKENNISKMYHRHLVNFSCVRFDARDAIKGSAIEGIIVGSKTVELSDNVDTVMKQHKTQRSEPLKPGLSNPQISSPAQKRSRGFLGFGKKSAPIQQQDTPKQIRGSVDDLSKLDVADLNTSSASRVGQATGKRRMSLKEKQEAYQRLQQSSVRNQADSNDGDRDSQSSTDVRSEGPQSAGTQSRRSILNPRNIALSHLVDDSSVNLTDQDMSPDIQSQGVPFDMSSLVDGSIAQEVSQKVLSVEPEVASDAESKQSESRNRYLENADFSDVGVKQEVDDVFAELGDPNLKTSKESNDGYTSYPIGGPVSSPDVVSGEVRQAQGYGPHDFDAVHQKPKYRYNEGDSGKFDPSEASDGYGDFTGSTMGSVVDSIVDSMGVSVGSVGRQSISQGDQSGTSQGIQPGTSYDHIPNPGTSHQPGAVPPPVVNNQDILNPSGAPNGAPRRNPNGSKQPSGQNRHVAAGAGKSPAQQTTRSQQVSQQSTQSQQVSQQSTQGSRNPFSKATALLGGMKQLTTGFSKGKPEQDSNTSSVSVHNPAESTNQKQVVGFTGQQVNEAVTAYSNSRKKTKLAGNFPDLAKCSEMQKRAHTFFITGDRRSGKSGTTANLGMIGATAGLHTLIIDLDLKGRGMSLYFPQDINPEDNIYTASISNALRSPHMIKDYTWEVNPLLDVLGLDLTIDDPDLHIKSLTDQKIQMLLAEAHTKYDLILVDFPFDMLVQFGTVLTQCDRLAYVTENDVGSMVNIINLISPGVFNASVDYHMFRSKLGFILNRYNPNHTMHESVIEPQYFTLMLNNLVEDGEWAKYPIYGTVEELKTYSKQMDNGMLLCNSKGFDELFFEMLYCMYR